MQGASAATYEYDEAAVLSGDEEAFEALVRSETPRLYRLIVRILRDEDEARSVLQETFLTAYESLSRFGARRRRQPGFSALRLTRAAARRASRGGVPPVGGP